MKKALVIACFLAGFTILFFSSCEPDPLPGYDQLNAEVDYLEFFESGRDLVPYGDREYDTFFDPQTARYICYELGLSFNAPGRRVNFTLDVVYYNPDGSQLDRFDHNTAVEASWTRSAHAGGYGWDEPGNWQEGMYTVKIYEKRSGNLLASESFVIDSEPGPVPPPPPSDRFTIFLSANPAAGGTVSGGGTYNRGDSVTVTASANSGYTFKNWTEGGRVVSTDATYTFSATANRTLVANFEQGQTPDQPYTITVSGDDSGKDVDGTTVVSRQYDLTVTDLTLSSGNLFVELPVDPTYMDNYSEDDLITVEYFDEQTGQWLSAGVMSYYDPEAHIIYFELPVSLLAGQAMYSFARSEGILVHTLQQSSAGASVQLRITRSWDQHGDWTDLYFADSPFKIKYQDWGNNKVISDDQWRGTGKTYKDQDGNSIPNYIGDLHNVLNETYTALLTLVDGSGKEIFNPVGRIAVFVKRMGAAGQANLGGPMEFNIKMDDYAEMRRVVAHEMVHILQGQYYTAKGLFTGRQNRWFIEATAQYFGQLVIGLSGTERRDFYLGEDYTSYLSVPISDSNSASYYTAGHFLDWLSHTYSTTLVQDTLRASWGNDINALSRQLESVGCTGGINEAYEKYVAYLMTHPDEGAGIGPRIKNRMAGFPENKFNFPSPMFTPVRTFIEFETTVPHLAARYVVLSNTPNRPVNRSALLVVESKKSVAALNMMTYDFVGSTNSDYAGKSSIDENHDYAKKPLTVKDFGQGRRFDRFEQMFLNTSGSPVDVEMSYYLLVAPEIKEIQEGAVLWDTSLVGNIPLAYIQGYNVYRGSVKLNDNLIAFQHDSQSFSHQGIKADSDITVQIVDKYDNKWPEVEDRDVSLTITPDEILDGRVDEEYTFSLKADNIPREVLHVYFEWDFGDLQTHGKGRSPSMQVTAEGRVEMDIAHTYRSDQFLFGQPESTVTVILKDAISDDELARATAQLSFYTVTIQGSRTITYTLPADGRTDTTLDFEAVASPDGAYRFVWNFDDGSPEVPDTPAPGQSSKVSHDYTGLKDGDIFRPRVELRSLDGQQLLATDSVRFDIAGQDPVDPGDFETVIIGSQVWMTKNLNIATGNSRCYDDNPANCAIYGRLYDWRTALTVCPPGWRLPSYTDWDDLINFLGENAGGKMKSTTLWSSPNISATNSSGWSGLPGGWHNGEYFGGLRDMGFWWSSTSASDDKETAWGIYLVNTRSVVSRLNLVKEQNFSVRCLKDDN